MQLPPWHQIKSNVLFYFYTILCHLWNIIVTIFIIVLQAKKLYFFYAPASHENFSMVSPFLFFIINLIKLVLGKYGNRSENIPFLVAGIVFSIGSILMEVYFLIWQPYLWSYEAILHYISIVFDGIFIIFSIILIIIFAATKNIEPNTNYVNTNSDEDGSEKHLKSD